METFRYNGENICVPETTIEVIYTIILTKNKKSRTGLVMWNFLNVLDFLERYKNSCCPWYKRFWLWLKAWRLK